MSGRERIDCIPVWYFFLSDDGEALNAAFADEILAGFNTARLLVVDLKHDGFSAGKRAANTRDQSENNNIQQQ